MTTENLIPSPQLNQEGEEKPTQSTSVDSNQAVEPNQKTNLMAEADTSNKGIDWEKRYKDLQSFHSKRENELRKQIQELEAEDSSFKAPTTPEQMEAFKEEHPEVYNMMLTLAHQKASEATQGISAQLQTYEEERMMNQVAEAKARLQNAHPDYVEIVSTDEFQEWAQIQPPRVQEWIYNNPDDADLAIIALDRYKAQRHAQEAHAEKEAQQSRATSKKDNSAAEAVGKSSAPNVTGGEKIWTASEIKKLSRDEWKKHEAEIDKAYAEGRVNFNA